MTDKFTFSILILIIAMLTTVVIIVYNFDTAKDEMKSMECPGLLPSIQKEEGFYSDHYDVREWIAKECWKES